MMMFQKLKTVFRVTVKVFVLVSQNIPVISYHRDS